MKTRKVILLICVILAGCLGIIGIQARNSKKSDNSDSAEKIIRAMCEYPGEGIYVKSQGPYIPLDAEEIPETSEGEDDYSRWNEALGEFFADRCFDSFYNDSLRTVILDEIAFDDLTSSVLQVSVEEQSDDIVHYEALLQVKKDDKTIGEYSLEWRVIYSSDKSGTVQKVELQEYGKLFDDCTEYREG